MYKNVREREERGREGETASDPQARSANNTNGNKNKAFRLYLIHFDMNSNIIEIIIMCALCATIKKESRQQTSTVSRHRPRADKKRLLRWALAYLYTYIHICIFCCLSVCMHTYKRIFGSLWGNWTARNIFIWKIQKLPLTVTQLMLTHGLCPLIPQLLFSFPLPLSLFAWQFAIYAMFTCWLLIYANTLQYYSLYMHLYLYLFLYRSNWNLCISVGRL